MANEDVEGSTRPQASFARKYQITTLNKFMMKHFCCYHNVLHVAGSLCGEMFNLHDSMDCTKVQEEQR